MSRDFQQEGQSAGPRCGKTQKPLEEFRVPTAAYLIDLKELRYTAPGHHPHHPLFSVGSNLHIEARGDLCLVGPRDERRSAQYEREEQTRARNKRQVSSNRRRHGPVVDANSRVWLADLKP